MAYYIFNKISDTILFKGGFLVVKPGTWEQVTAQDVKSGVFDSAVMSHHIEIAESDHMPGSTPLSVNGAKIKPEPPPASVITGGMNETEYMKFLAEKEAAKAEAAKTAVAAPAPAPVEAPAPAPVEAPAPTPTTAKATKKVETPASAPAPVEPPVV